MWRAGSYIFQCKVYNKLRDKFEKLLDKEKIGFSKLHMETIDKQIGIFRKRNNYLLM